MGRHRVMHRIVHNGVEANTNTDIVVYLLSKFFAYLSEKMSSRLGVLRRMINNRIYKQEWLILIY